MTTSPDLTWELVRVWGVVGGDGGPELQDGVRAFLELLELPDDRSEYPYATFDGEDRTAAAATDPAAIVATAATAQSVELGRGDAPLRYRDTELTVELFVPPDEPDVAFGYRLWIDPVQFAPDDASDTPVAEHARQVGDLVVETHDVLPTFYAYGYGVTGWRDAEFHPDRAALADGRLHDLHWLNLLSPAMVDAIGRERVASCSAWDVRELETGAVLLLTHENPRAWDERSETVAEELGLSTPG